MEGFRDVGFQGVKIVCDAGQAFGTLEQIGHTRWQRRPNACSSFDRVGEFRGVRGGEGDHRSSLFALFIRYFYADCGMRAQEFACGFQECGDGIAGFVLGGAT